MSGIKELQLADLWPVMAEQLDAGKTVRFAPKGVSMLPLIRQDLDTVVIKTAPPKLKKYDLALYRRKNGQFVLHRVVGVNKDGSYVMCGDNQYWREYGITDENILAMAVGYYKGNEYISFDDENYIKYSKKRVREQYIRYCFARVKAGFKRRIEKT